MDKLRKNSNRHNIWTIFLANTRNLCQNFNLTNANSDEEDLNVEKRLRKNLERHNIWTLFLAIQEIFVKTLH